MTVRMLAGLLPLFVLFCLWGFFFNCCWSFFVVVFVMFERGMEQQQPLPLIRNLKLQLLSTRDLNGEKTRGKLLRVYICVIVY